MTASGQPPRRFLVVDDEPSVCDALKMLLEFDGHKVVTVNSAKDALACLENHPFDALITDYWMPPMHGDELARIVKQERGGLPVIMITAWPEKLPTPLQNIDAVLTKPFLLENLREAIIRTTGGKSSKNSGQAQGPD